MIGVRKKTLSQSLIEAGLIPEDQLRQAELEARNNEKPLRKVLVRRGWISEEDLCVFVSQHFNLSFVDLNNYLIDPEIMDLVTEELARKHMAVPILKLGNELTVALADPLDVFAIDELRNKTGLDIDPALATETGIEKTLNQYYRARGSMEEVLENLDRAKMELKPGQENESQTLMGIAEEPPVIKLVNLMMIEAVHAGASDIHIEPEEETLKIRFRVDGVLHERSAPPKYLQSAVISRIKVLANLNIAERRVPQDGRIEIKMEGRDIDLRVSTIPTLFGENVVMRLLDRSQVLLNLEQLGFKPEMLEQYQELLKRPYGLVLVCGPTGSGKTTTLYTSLNAIDAATQNIMTIEDPVEYQLTGVRQMQVNPQVELSFARGLSALLRQDPDVIMVGEIRDPDTAKAAIQAALTGHLVFSTLHTNDAAGAVTRLVEMGVEPYLVASTLIGALSQRLVRTICKQCQGERCKTCYQSGLKGRLGLFELLIPDKAVHDLIAKNAATSRIKSAAVKAGMRLLHEDGQWKVTEGITTEEEVLRVAVETH